ncbi:MAG: hypothetical protein RLZZ444_997 [Pseudomonadota bacterium]|uniref:hypothetical protein n=1 Tax=unclassified Novosphingobium TaxID=2644732 RepID=UPI0011D2A31F|nr:hypothetical protein [Novosphingobium sp. B-7]
MILEAAIARHGPDRTLTNYPIKRGWQVRLFALVPSCLKGIGTLRGLVRYRLHRTMTAWCKLRLDEPGND